MSIPTNRRRTRTISIDAIAVLKYVYFGCNNTNDILIDYKNSSLLSFCLRDEEQAWKEEQEEDTLLLFPPSTSSNYYQQETNSSDPSLFFSDDYDDEEFEVSIFK
jgi:hypothetical protein